MMGQKEVERMKSFRKKVYPQRRGPALLRIALPVLLLLLLLCGCASWSASSGFVPPDASAQEPSAADSSGAAASASAGSVSGTASSATSEASKSPVSADAGAEHVQEGETTSQTEPSPLTHLTLREKLCQMLIVTPEALPGAGDPVVNMTDECAAALEAYPVGGVILFAKNLRSPEQLKALISDLQAASAVPLFVSVDEEGGSVARIANSALFGAAYIPNAKTLGREGVPAVRAAGETVGAYLKELGFNMDFAPVADVLTGGGSKVIGSRSFGTDPAHVGACAAAFAAGLESQGIIPVYKHFPGHGGPVGDTHEGFSATPRTLEELEAEELLPFRTAIYAGARCIMAAHLAAPALSGDETPASLSHAILTDLLREEMGYDGLIVTDALNMGAIAENYATGEAAVLAVEAGADLLLMPSDVEATLTALVSAVEDGRISEARIDESVERILKVKEKLS